MLQNQADVTQDARVMETMTLEALDMDTIRRHQQRMDNLRPGYVWSELPTEEFLHRIGAMARDAQGCLRPTAAGLLMFGAETALENAGDHREFRPRPHLAAVAVGFGKNGDTSGRIAEPRKAEILQYLTDTPQASATEIARAIGLQASGTRKYLSELTAEGAIVAEGEIKGRRYRLRA